MVIGQSYQRIFIWPTRKESFLLIRAKIINEAISISLIIPHYTFLLNRLYQNAHPIPIPLARSNYSLLFGLFWTDSFHEVCFHNQSWGLLINYSKYKSLKLMNRQTSPSHPSNHSACGRSPLHGASNLNTKYINHLLSTTMSCLFNFWLTIMGDKKYCIAQTALQDYVRNNKVSNHGSPTRMDGKIARPPLFSCLYFLFLPTLLKAQLIYMLSVISSLQLQLTMRTMNINRRARELKTIGLQSQMGTGCLNIQQKDNKIVQDAISISNHDFCSKREKYTKEIREELDPRDKEYTFPFQTTFSITQYPLQRGITQPQNPPINQETNTDIVKKKCEEYLKLRRAVFNYASEVCENVSSISFRLLSKGELSDGEAKAFAVRIILANIHSFVTDLHSKLQKYAQRQEKAELGRQFDDLMEVLTKDIDEELYESFINQLATIHRHLLQGPLPT